VKYDIVFLAVAYRCMCGCIRTEMYESLVIYVGVVVYCVKVWLWAGDLLVRLY